MPFSYYARLSQKQKDVYSESDRITSLRLPRPEELRPLVGVLEAALASEARAAVEAAAARLSLGITDMLRVCPVQLRVLAARPSSGWGELHGLYTHDEGKPPRIQLWMRTAHHRRVVAFRTFLRTLLHEVGHHLDYEHLLLEDSFHTQGFFQRESSLFHQLVGTPEIQPGEPEAVERPT